MILKIWQVNEKLIHIIFEKVGEKMALSGASMDAIKAAIDAGLVRETQRLNNLMVLLTIAISGGPFLGLLGTVVGVMITFAAIAAAGDVNVNAIAPGFIETDMTHYLKEGEAAQAFLSKIPLGRFGSAEEIGNTTLFLASDMSSYITGQVLSVCGGLNI